MPTAAAVNLKWMSKVFQQLRPLALRRLYVSGNPSGDAWVSCSTNILRPVLDEMRRLAGIRGESCTLAAAYSFCAELRLSCGRVLRHHTQCREH
jgi:hypothetical protein